MIKWGIKMKKIVSIIMAVVMCLSVIAVGSTASVSAKTKKPTVKLIVVDMKYKKHGGYAKFKVISSVQKNTYYVGNAKKRTYIAKNKCFKLSCCPNKNVTISLKNKYSSKYNISKTISTNRLYYCYYIPDNGTTPIYVK